MCGINGILRLTDRAPSISRDELRATRDRMASRGPDGVGEWFAPTGEVALGHRRLAIIDLSDAGAQPMVRSNRYYIVYNGEIYNYQDLRSELARQGVRFDTASDTEVILALYEREGSATLRKLRGMFTLAIWDCTESTLLLARDPYGIKPLFYSCSEGMFRFASQVRALSASAAVSAKVDPAGLVGFLLWGSVPEPLTIRQGIRTLKAGHYVRVSSRGVSEPKAFARIGSGHSSRRAADPSDPVGAVEESVRYHLVSDVPVGSFLSAGMDSAIVTALASRQLPEPITTFTVRFEAYRDSPLDEGPLAARVARALGTNHVEHTVARNELNGLWPEVIGAMDQPSIDGFNTYLVSKLARQHGLKVVLSGLGGDELLGGYPSFRDVPRWAYWSRAGSRLPGASAALELAAKALGSHPKLAGMLKYGPSLAGAYFLRRGLFLPEELPGLIGEDLAHEGLAHYNPIRAVEETLNSSLANDSMSDWVAVHLMESCFYMRNQLLRDSDWASMAHSLELRVPFVDPMLQSCLSAADFQPARDRGKAAFFRSFSDELPAELWNRPKSGFMVPMTASSEDSGGPSASNHGADSRKLALRILQESGIGVDRRATQ